MDFADIELGIALLDHEHRQLAALFDEFEQCFHRRVALETGERLVQDALMLANDHFEHEEALMDEAGYPQSAEHKFQHRNLRLQCTTLVIDAMAHFRLHDAVTLQHLAAIRRLLTEHIAGADAALAVYLKTAAPPVAA